MTERSVVGMYETMAQAEEAVHTLAQAGFPVKHVSIVRSNGRPPAPDLDDDDGSGSTRFKRPSASCTRVS
jgi:hypothetical protein